MTEPLFSGWCVMVKAKRGAWWSHPSWIGTTRTEALNQYMLGHSNKMRPYYGPERKSYEREARKGEVKVVRFVAHQAAARGRAAHA